MVNFIDKCEAVIFDIDGVLVDVRKSYNEAIIKTVHLILKDSYDIEIANKFPFEKLISKLRNTGGFNNDIDTAYVIILVMLHCILINKMDIDIYITEDDIIHIDMIIELITHNITIQLIYEPDYHKIDETKCNWNQMIESIRNNLSYNISWIYGGAKHSLYHKNSTLTFHIETENGFSVDFKYPIRDKIKIINSFDEIYKFLILKCFNNPNPT